MKELVKPVSLENNYELMTFLDESCSSGCNKVCCDSVRGCTNTNPNSSMSGEDELLF